MFKHLPKAVPPAVTMNLRVICTATVSETTVTFQRGLGMLQSMGLSGGKGEGERGEGREV